MQFDRGQRKYSSDLLKNVCLMDLAGAGYQFMNGTHLGVIVMFVFGIILGAAGILAAKGTENNT